MHPSTSSMFLDKLTCRVHKSCDWYVCAQNLELKTVCQISRICSASGGSVPLAGHQMLRIWTLPGSSVPRLHDLALYLLTHFDLLPTTRRNQLCSISIYLPTSPQRHFYLGNHFRTLLLIDTSVDLVVT